MNTKLCIRRPKPFTNIWKVRSVPAQKKNQKKKNPFFYKRIIPHDFSSIILFLRIIFIHYPCDTVAQPGPSSLRVFPHASCWFAAVNNPLCDLFIWANSVSSLSPITLPVGFLFRTVSYCLMFKSIPLQEQKMPPCAHPLSSISASTLNMLYKMKASQKKQTNYRTASVSAWIVPGDKSSLSCFISFS